MAGEILVVKHIISLQHALRIIKKLGMRKHRHLNWSYDLEEAPYKYGQLKWICLQNGQNIEDVTFSKYKPDEQLFHLHVYKGGSNP